MTTASFIYEDFSWVNVCEQRYILQEVGRHVEQVAFLDVLSLSSIGPYSLIYPSPGF
jgi:hypothetical protein